MTLARALRASALAFDDTYRTIAADVRPHPLVAGLVEPAEVDRLVEVIGLTGLDAAQVLGNVGLVPPEDRPSGPGAGWALMAFTRPAWPSRFSDGTRGVWYAADSVATSLAEVRFHAERRLRAWDEPSQALPRHILHAQVVGVGVDARRLTGSAYSRVHDADPEHYAYAQAFGAARHAARDDLIAYHSVRAMPRRTRTCIAVLRPRAIRNAAPRFEVVLSWDGRRVAAGRPRAL